MKRMLLFSFLLIMINIFPAAALGEVVPTQVTTTHPTLNVSYVNDSDLSTGDQFNIIYEIPDNPDPYYVNVTYTTVQDTTHDVHINSRHNIVNMPFYISVWNFTSSEYNLLDGITTGGFPFFDLPHVWNTQSLDTNYVSGGVLLVSYRGAKWSSELSNTASTPLYESMVNISNIIPTVSDVSISPSPANDTDDLTALNGSIFDQDGDTVVLYYKWYKDGIQQNALNNISTVLANNTSAGEVWKVGIIPNDGYENGTEVQSSTVTIDSPNIAPTLTGIEANASIKYNKTILITTIGASDSNGDNYTLYIGSTSGATDLCVNGNVTNGTQATCEFLVPWTSGTHTIYGFLDDGEDTSIIYNTIITVDTTPPIIGATSISPSSAPTGENIIITASVTVANGSISTVYAVINNINYTMSGSNGSYSYTFSSNAAGMHWVTFSATDDSGNIGYKLTSDTFYLSPSEGGGSSSGGDDDTDINNEAPPTISPDILTGIAGGDTIPDDFWTDDNLRIHPVSLNSTAFYTGWDKPQNVTYRFITNKFIDSCEVLNGTCTIDQKFLINFNTVIDSSTSEYRGMLTVYMGSETAQTDIYINIINLCACKDITTPWQLNISNDSARSYAYFVGVEDGAVVCIRWLFMIILLAVLLGIVYWDSTRKP